MARLTFISAIAAVASVFVAIASPLAGAEVGRPGPDPAEARRYLATIQESPELQALLDESFAELGKRDAALRRTGVRVAVLELDGDRPPLLAHLNGRTPVYPASVVKFVYLMAAYAFRDRGQLEIDAALDRELHDMIFQSSNTATQRVVARVTATEPGPELAAATYQEFKDRRLSVKRWLAELGIDELHCVSPTYNGNDISPRERQFLRDDSLPGALPSKGGEFRNRQAMTAVDTAELLALLATDRALSPESSAEVRRRMRRRVAQQPHLALRIAGGAEDVSKEFVVEAKTGTWGPIFADAGVVRAPDGRALAIAAFLDSTPAYRGNFIAELTERVVRARLLPDAKKP
jgi:beta-lactamase class A